MSDYHTCQVDTDIHIGDIRICTYPSDKKVENKKVEIIDMEIDDSDKRVWFIRVIDTGYCDVEPYATQFIEHIVQKTSDREYEVCD